MADSHDTEPANDEMRERHSRLKRLAVRGSLFEMLAYVLGQVLRLGGNLILTRLLFPEAFGLMTTLTVFNTGLIMLSDVGIEQSVIQNERGDEPVFANTAWTLQIVRGLSLYGVALALTWPMAQLEGVPELLWLIPVGALSVPIAALSSTAEFALRRQVRVGRLVGLELASQAVALGVMLAWAWVHPSIWALIVGNIAREIFRTIASHLVLVPGYRNRLSWDAAARAEIIAFGRWILGSSAVFFLAGFADRLLLLPFLQAGGLGIYSIAALLTESAFTVIGKITHGVLFPIFSRIRLDGVDRLQEVYYQARLRLDLLALGGVGALFMVGPRLIDFLWDDRYHEAGWMLQILCVKAATRSVFDPADKCLVALGRVRTSFINNAARTVFLFAGVPIGWHFLGEEGVVWGVVASDLPCAFILWTALWREKVLRVDRELLAWVFFGAGLGVGFGVDALLALLLP
ncbi:MAG: oligosaccharide flippase family protein [Myxococcales bacterium]|nr:oligosaccharide flippase family protein [Myxococcales bacterium]